MEGVNNHNVGFQRVLGGVGALLQAGLMLSDYAEFETDTPDPVYLAFALLFLASALFAVLGPLQAALFFGLSALQTAHSLDPFYGLGFAVVAAFIVFRRGWFFRHRLIKASIIAATGSATLILPILASGKPPMALAPACVSAAIFSILVIGLAKGRVLSAFMPRKPLVRLASYNLTKRECQVIKARILGKTVKELALENGLAVSTVRNALAKGCHKLGIEGRETLMALGENFRVE
jgi:DNA-binding CsgD family transcriptional regulator